MLTEPPLDPPELIPTYEETITRDYEFEAYLTVYLPTHGYASLEEAQKAADGKADKVQEKLDFLDELDELSLEEKTVETSGSGEKEYVFSYYIGGRCTAYLDHADWRDPDDIDFRTREYEDYALELCRKLKLTDVRLYCRHGY